MKSMQCIISNYNRVFFSTAVISETQEIQTSEIKRPE